MSTTETHVFLFNVPGDVLPEPGETGIVGVNMYTPALVAAYGEGWEPVSHTMSPAPDGNLIVSILAVRKTSVPDDAGDLS